MRRHTIGAAGAGALVVAVVLVAAGCGSVRAVPGPAPTAGRSAAGASGTAVPAGADPYTWSRVAAAVSAGAPGSSATVSDVVAPSTTGAPWVAAGTQETSAGSSTATVWLSVDARTWTPVTLPGTGGRALAVAMTSQETVVVGSVAAGSGERAAVWRAAAPAGPYTLVPDDPAFAFAGPAGTGTSAMDLVSAGTLGFVAAGADGGQPAVWYSSDGATWSQDRGADVLLGGHHDATVDTVLIDPDGALLAGSERHGTETDGELWYSSDGIHWHAYRSGANPFVGAGDHRIDGLAWTGTALVAVGSVRSSQAWMPATWISPDGGTTWSQTNTALLQTGPASAGGATVRAVSVAPGVGGPLVAVGGGTDGGQELWTSTAGTVWAAEPIPAPSGWTADQVATAASTAGESTTVVADDEPGQAVLAVLAGGRWRVVDLAPPAPVAEPAALVSSQGHLVLAVDVATPASASHAGRRTVVVLTSATGRTWARMAAGGTFAGARVTGLYAQGGNLVAVGTDGSGSAALWESVGGRRWHRATLLPGEPAGALPTTVGALGATTVAAGVADAGGGGQAVGVAWTADGGTPTSGSAMDPVPTTALDDPVGSCAGTTTMVAVGWRSLAAAPGRSTAPAGPAATTSTTLAPVGTRASAAGQADDGSQAATWATTDGQTWTPGTVQPAPGVGSPQSMDGCMAVGSGFVAWGTTVGAGGSTEPGLWRSADGTSWAQLDPPGLSGGQTGMVDLAASGTTWLGVGGGQPAALASPEDPLASVTDPQAPAPVVAAATGPDGPVSLWLSTNDGSQWTQLVAGSPPWSGAQQAAADLAGWTASGDPVVAGTVDGQLAVWVGSPAAGT